MLNRVMILCSTECFDTHSFDTHGTFIYVKCFSGKKKKKTYIGGGGESVVAILVCMLQFLCQKYSHKYFLKLGVSVN